MAKRRRRYQFDRRKGRKRVPPPTDGWLLAELCKLTHVRPSTVRSYIKQRLLHRPVFRGRATRYDRLHLLRLMAVRHLKLNGHLYLDRICNQLNKWTTEQLERWVLSQPNPSVVIEALKQRTVAHGPTPVATAEQSPAAPRNGSASAQTATSASSAPVISSPEWQTIALLPGLELRLLASAGPAVQRVASHLCGQIGTLLEKGLNS